MLRNSFMTPLRFFASKTSGCHTYFPGGTAGHSPCWISSGNNDGSYRRNKRWEEWDIWTLRRRASRVFKSDCSSCYRPLPFIIPSPQQTLLPLRQSPSVSLLTTGHGPHLPASLEVEGSAPRQLSPADFTLLPHVPGTGPFPATCRVSIPWPLGLGRISPLLGFLFSWACKIPLWIFALRLDLETVSEVQGEKSWQCSIVQSLDKLRYFPRYIFKPKQAPEVTAALFEICYQL